MVATVPAGALSGILYIVTQAGAPSNQLPFAVAVPPSITSLSSSAGGVGNVVTIAGANFGSSQGSSTVTFNGAPATTFGNWTDSAITVTVPPGATSGSVIVTVNGIPSNGVSFTVVAAPSITGVSPGSGPVGTVVTISGANFGATQGSSFVTFNRAPATPAQWSDTAITVAVPSNGTTGNVVVSVYGLASNGVSFTVVGAPGFTATGGLRTPRFGDTATVLNNGLVLVAGGLDNDNNLLASAELYDPVTGTFYLTGDLNTARYAHTATLLNDGTVLLVGGLDKNGNRLTSAEIYDPATGKLYSQREPQHAT